MKNFFAEKFFIILHDFAASLSNIITFFQFMLQSSYKNNLINNKIHLYMMLIMNFLILFFK